VLTVHANSLDVALVSRLHRLEWVSAGRSSKAAGSADLAASLVLQEDHLIADMNVPVKATLELDGSAPSNWDLRLPLLVVMDDHLQPSAPGSDRLWDAGYYEKLWRSYRPRHATAPFAIIDRDELALGPLSLRQVTFPSGPLQVAVGYGDALEFHAPISARFLYGQSEGYAQARLRWLGNALSVDTRAGATLRDLQAGAVRLGHAQAPLLDDMLAGHVALQTDRLLLDREFLPRALSNPAAVTELDKIGLNLNLHSTGPRPGVLQFETQTDLRLSNELLNAIVAQFQMQAPPRAVRYRDLAFRFQVSGGEVQTKPLLLDLKGVEVPNLVPIPVDGEIRVHWGRQRPGFAGSPLRLRNLLGFLQRTLAGFVPD
jgi:hypothetical protein